MTLYNQRWLGVEVRYFPSPGLFVRPEHPTPGRFVGRAAVSSLQLPSHSSQPAVFLSKSIPLLAPLIFFEEGNQARGRWGSASGFFRASILFRPPEDVSLTPLMSKQGRCSNHFRLLEDISPPEGFTTAVVRLSCLVAHHWAHCDSPPPRIYSEGFLYASGWVSGCPVQSTPRFPPPLLILGDYHRTRGASSWRSRSGSLASPSLTLSGCCAQSYRSQGSSMALSHNVRLWWCLGVLIIVGSFMIIQCSNRGFVNFFLCLETIWVVSFNSQSQKFSKISTATNPS